MGFVRQLNGCLSDVPRLHSPMHRECPTDSYIMQHRCTTDTRVYYVFISVSVADTFVIITGTLPIDNFVKTMKNKGLYLIYTCFFFFSEQKPFVICIRLTYVSIEISMKPVKK